MQQLASESKIAKLLPSDEKEARIRMRKGRTGSLLVDEMLKNTDLSDLAEDAPVDEILEKAVLTAVNTQVDERVKDMTDKMNVKETVGEMQEKEIYKLKADLRRTEARYTLELENLKKDHKNEMDELRKKNINEGLPQLRALRAEYDEQKRTWEISMKEMQQQSSEEFRALEDKNRGLESEVTRLKERYQSGNSGETKKMIVVTNNEESEELQSEVVRLRAMSQSAELEASKTVKEMERIAKESEQDRQELFKMKRDKDSESQDTVMIRMKVTQLEEQLKKSKEEAENLKSQFAASIKSLESENEELRMELKESREKEDALNTELDMVREQIAMLEWTQSGRNESRENFQSQEYITPRDSQHSGGSGDGDQPQTLVFIPKKDTYLSPHIAYSPHNQFPKSYDGYDEDGAGLRQHSYTNSDLASPLDISAFNCDSIVPSTWPKLEPPLSLSTRYRMSIIDKDQAGQQQKVDNMLTVKELERMTTEYEKVNAENNVLKEEISRLREETDRLEQQVRDAESLSNIPHDNLNADGSNPETLEEIKAQHSDQIEKLNEKMDSLIATHEQELKEFTLRVTKQEEELKEVKAQQEAELKDVKAQQEAELRDVKAQQEAELKEVKVRQESLQKDHNALLEERTEIVEDRDLRLAASTRLVLSLSNEIDKLRERFS